MDWFEKLVGFSETNYEETRARLQVEDKKLRSLINGASYGVGELELVSLQALRDRAKDAGDLPGRLQTSVVTGDVRKMHRSAENAGALFQVASQFNLLEMVSPNVTPDDGVARYQNDHTQGPACAIAAGAATIYRNYFAPMEGGFGQTAARQIDGLADLGTALSNAMTVPVAQLWRMQNGYALGTQTGLDMIARYLGALSPEDTDVLRGKLCIGLHRDIEVTEAAGPKRPEVSQSFCSALPVAYSHVPPAHWQAFASLVLEAAYEATMWATVLNAQRGCLECCLSHSSRRRRIRQQRSMDPWRIGSGTGTHGNVRSRCEDCQLRTSVRRAHGNRQEVCVICILPPTPTRSQRISKGFGMSITSGISNLTAMALFVVET